MNDKNQNKTNVYLLLQTVDYPKTPNIAKLIEGPSAVGYMRRLGDLGNGEDLCHLIGIYVAKSYGVTNIRKQLNENKGMTWLDIMTLNQFTNMITILSNHKDQWTQEQIILNRGVGRKGHSVWLSVGSVSPPKNFPASTRPLKLSKQPKKTSFQGDLDFVVCQ